MIEIRKKERSVARQFGLKFCLAAGIANAIPAAKARQACTADAYVLATQWRAPKVRNLLTAIASNC
jgi:hypothetical protein